MRVEVIMPQMGESIVEGTIVAWHKQVGDAVERDEDIFTIQTDKVDAEIPSPQSGILVQIVAQVGETIEVGKVVAWVETDVAAAAAAPAPAAAPAAAAAPSSIPPIHESAVSAGIPAAASASAPSSALLPIHESAADSAASDSASASAEDSAGAPARYTPLVRRIAQENGVKDLSAIQGTGVSGRVTKTDILRYLAERTIAASAPAPASAPSAPMSPPIHESGGAAAGSSAAAGSAATPAKPVFEGIPAGFLPVLYKPARIFVGENDRVEPLSRMRAAIAENMANARRSTAHCHTVWEADLTQVMKARKAMKAEYEGRGVNLTLTAFFVQAVIEALRAYPIMNSAFDGEKIVYRGNVNIGIASALEDGLIVPVLKQADGLNLVGVARGINDLGARSKAKKLVPTDVTDGTFTISNSGVFGSLFGIPILVTPQVGILNIGGIQKRVVADEDDNIRIRSIVTMCLTFDHRVIDGATADGFCGHIARRLNTWK